MRVALRVGWASWALRDEDANHLITGRRGCKSTQAGAWTGNVVSRCVGDLGRPMRLAICGRLGICPGWTQRVGYIYSTVAMDAKLLLYESAFKERLGSTQVPGRIATDPR